MPSKKKPSKPLVRLKVPAPRSPAPATQAAPAAARQMAAAPAAKPAAPQGKKLVPASAAKAAPTPAKNVAPPPAKKSAPPPKVAPEGPTTATQQRAIMNMKAFFERTLSALEEADSLFAPAPEMFTVAQQVAHAAQTYDWFREGAFASKGFRMDFPAMEAEVRKVTSLAAAKAWLDEAHQRLLKALQSRPYADWSACIVKDTIMGGAPRLAIVDGLVDHTAHHRGALAVYARLRGKTPPMPYM